MNTIINIIHLPQKYFTEQDRDTVIKHTASALRLQSILEQMNEQNAKFKIWDGILDGVTGCSQSHKMIVRDAKEKGLDRIIIAEDDIKFFAPGAFQYFLDCIPETFDLYLGTTYSMDEYPDNKVVGMFDSLTLYIIDKKFYDQFLAMPEDNHIDRELCKLLSKGADFKICQPIVCEQIDGYSFLAKRVRTYGHRMVDKIKFQ